MEKHLPCLDYNALARLIIENFPRAHGESDPFRILVSTVLSQRSKDENTELASKRLFGKFGTVEKLAGAQPEELHELIKPAGLYREKARRIVELARIIRDQHGGRVPDELEELLKLPGVGRKTANIVLSIGFGKPALAVDTHVHRISNRLGWVRTKTPERTEEELTKILSPELWGPINGSMVEFGKAVCRPVSPRCDVCFIKPCCEFGKSRTTSAGTERRRSP